MYLSMLGFCFNLFFEYIFFAVWCVSFFLYICFLCFHVLVNPSVRYALLSWSRLLNELTLYWVQHIQAFSSVLSNAFITLRDREREWKREKYFCGESGICRYKKYLKIFDYVALLFHRINIWSKTHHHCKISNNCRYLE